MRFLRLFLYKRWMCAFIALNIIVLVADTPLASAAAKIDLDEYISFFYNREIKNFKKFGEIYQMPLYGIKKFRPLDSSRKVMETAIFYKYKISDAKTRQNVRQKILNSTVLRKRKLLKSSQSFNDAISNFLILNYLKKTPNLFSAEEKNQIRQWIGSYLEGGVLSRDTENRAVIASALWQIVANDLFENDIIANDEKMNIDHLIKNKIDSAIKKSVNKNYWYLESGKFSPHYHLITALMMAAYGDTTKQKKYLIIAREMTKNIRDITFNNGMIVSDFDHRPIGSGAQTYLIAGLLNKRFNFKDYKVYLTYAKGGRFFSDKKRPNRLEFHSVIKNTNPLHHDDFGFVTIAELGLYLKSTKDLVYSKSAYSSNFKNISQDNTFSIKNTGKVIKINNNIYTLVGNGDAYTIRAMK